MTTPLPAEAPESADRTPFTIDDADAFTADVLALHRRIKYLKGESQRCFEEARRFDAQADETRRQLRDVERQLAHYVGLDW